MKLWTIQPYCVYELLQRNGVYRCDPKVNDFLDHKYIIAAYDWISNQMKKIIGIPDVSIKYPVWAWYVIEGKHKRPDMRKSCFKVFEKSVLLEIEIPDEDVLLTDHDYWHMPLNNSINYQANYIEPISDEEWYKEVEKEDKFYNSLNDNEKLLYKQKSWEKIICTKHSSIQYIQATFWELKKDQIQKVWILKG